MQRGKKLRIFIMLLMLAAAACVFIGWRTDTWTNFTMNTSYRAALFPQTGTVFKDNFTVYVWILLASGIIAAALIWIRKAWVALAACFVCLSSPVYHVIYSVQNSTSIFLIFGAWQFFMLVMPLIAAILCIVLYRKQRTAS